MAKKQKYLVVREHVGDRPYTEGEERTALAADVKHLVPHVLELLGDADGEDEAEGSGEKAEPAPSNKAEPAAPANKAATGRKSTKGE
jgi:hypothetical protein